jgi:hypothetical protein
MDYIHQCVAPPMNMWGQSKSNRTAYIFVGTRSKPTNITRFGIDKYNLNIFIGTDEFKKPMNK